MIDYHLAEAEARFADLIWAHEPITAADLARRAADALGWKRPTSYTVLRRLCERGLFRNEGGTVTSAVSRADFDAARSNQFVAESFGGSLPRFLAAFTGGRRLRAEEADALRRLIEEAED